MKKTAPKTFQKYRLATTTIGALDERQLALVDGGAVPLAPDRARTQGNCPVNH